MDRGLIDITEKRMCKKCAHMMLFETRNDVYCDMYVKGHHRNNGIIYNMRNYENLNDLI